MFSRPFLSTATRARRIVTGLALLAYVASVVGYPLPLPAAPQDTSTPFPCQGHACGCQSAAQCLESCCCHTAAERLAWAKTNAVTLPATIVATLQRQAAEELAESAEDETASCCHRASKCCDDKPATEASPTTIVWIDAIQAKKCQGLTTLWLVSGATLPLEILTLWEFEWVPAGDLPLLDDNSLVVFPQPDLRPPRV